MALHDIGWRGQLVHRQRCWSGGGRSVINTLQFRARALVRFTRFHNWTLARFRECDSESLGLSQGFKYRVAAMGSLPVLMESWRQSRYSESAAAAASLRAATTSSRWLRLTRTRTPATLPGRLRLGWGWLTVTSQSLNHKGCWIFALLRRRIVALGARGTQTGHEYLFVVSHVARENNIQSFRCKAPPLRPRKRAQRSISRTFYANVRWLRRPAPWPGAGAVTLCLVSAAIMMPWRVITTRTWNHWYYSFISSGSKSGDSDGSESTRSAAAARTGNRAPQ